MPNFPEGTPLWIIITFIALGSILTFSERLAKFKGPAGSLSRWWGNRQKQSIGRSTELHKAIAVAVDERVEIELQPVRIQLKSAQDQIKELRGVLDSERKASRETEDRLSNEVRLRGRYITLVASWYHNISVWAAQNGYILPPPPWPTYQEWKLEQAQKDKPGG